MSREKASHVEHHRHCEYCDGGFVVDLDRLMKEHEAIGTLDHVKFKDYCSWECMARDLDAEFRSDNWWIWMIPLFMLLVFVGLPILFHLVNTCG